MSGAAATYPVSTIAKLLMLTERRVQQLTKEGVLPKAERGRYELISVVQAYIKYLRDRNIFGDAPGEETDHRGRLLKARADIAQMEAERLAETHVSAEQVEAAWIAITTRMRQRVLAVAPKAAPLVAPETGTEQCHEIIETFIHEALAELAANPVEGPEPATGQDDAADAEEPGAAAEEDDIELGG